MPDLTCVACRQAKPPGAFGFRKDRGKFRTACRDCEAAKERARYAAKVAAAASEPSPAAPAAPHVFVPRHPMPSAADFAAEQRAAAPPPPRREEQLEIVEEHRLRRRVRELEAQAKSLIADLSDARHVNDIAREAAQHVVEPVVVRESRSGLREGTPLVLASDWHFEEHVRPEQVAGRNRFNLEIARARAVRFFHSMRWSRIPRSSGS